MRTVQTTSYMTLLRIHQAAQATAPAASAIRGASIRATLLFYLPFNPNLQYPPKGRGVLQPGQWMTARLIPQKQELCEIPQKQELCCTAYASLLSCGFNASGAPLQAQLPMRKHA